MRMMAAASLIAALASCYADAAQSSRVRAKAIPDFVVRKRTTSFPKTKGSDYGGMHEHAKLAFFVCRGGFDIAKTPEQAQSRCETRNAQWAKKGLHTERCRCTGRDAIAVYGPYKHQGIEKTMRPLPYEGTDGQTYTRKGEPLTP